MKQAYMPRAEVIEYREVPKPTPKGKEVLLKVSKIGICGSDLHVFEDKHPLVSFPLVQGHEFSGYVVEAGEDVTKVAVGDLTVVQPAIGCGHCERCDEGVFAQCDDLQFIGGALHGGGSEYFLVHEDHVIKLEKGVSPEDAAMIEPLAVAVHTVNKVSCIKGKNLLVIGAGTIGNLTAQVADLMGAAHVIVLDIDPNRIEIAKKTDLLVFDSSEPGEIPKIIHDITGKSQVDASFECVGGEVPLNTCVQYTRRGGHVIVPGVYSQDPRVRMIRVQDAELHMCGSLMYTWEDYHRAAAFTASREIDLAALRTHTVGFDEWIQGYRFLQDKTSGALKVMVDLDQ